MAFHKFARYALRIFLCLLLIFVLGLGIVYWLMQRNPQELASKYLGEVSQKTGLDISFKSVHVTLLPLPALGVGDLNIRGQDFELNIAWLSMRPALENLLHGDFMPGRISIVRPKLYASTKAALDDPYALAHEFRPISGAGKEAAKPINWSSFLPFYCGIDLIQGHAIISGPNGQKAVLNGLDGRVELAQSGALNGSLDFGHLRVSEGEKLLYALEAISILGDADIDDFFETEGKANVAGRLKIGTMLASADFNISLEHSPAAWSIGLNLDALLNLDGVHIPANFKGRFFSLADSNEILCRKANFSLDADSGSAELKFRLPVKDLSWEFEGKAFLHRASLTQWLGFARGLPPGLQLALDNITNARLEFILNANSLKVFNICATSTGATFRGTGGVPDFAAPVVELDLKSDKANLGLAIPESLIKSVQPVYFPYEPLTPRSGIPLPEGEQGIGYDIRLAATELIYGPVKIQNAKLRIYPGKMDAIRLEDVLLEGSGNFYGGNVKGQCILGADPSLPVYINSNAKNVNMAKLARALPLVPVEKGIFQAESAVFSRGKTLKEFLAQLDGPVKFSGSNVILGAAAKEELTRLVLNCQLKGAAMLKNGISFGGKWAMDAQMKDLDAGLELDGKLAFSNAGLTLKSVPASLKLNFREKAGPLPKNTAIALKGQLSGNSDSKQFGLSKLSLDLPGSKIDGNVEINMKNASCQGDLSAKVNDSLKLARFFSPQTGKLPPVFAKFELKGNYAASSRGIKIQKLNLKAQDLQASGNVDIVLENMPAFDFSLNVNKVDWEKQFGDSASQGKGKWDFSWLKNFNCKGDLLVNTFSGWGITLNSIKAPLKLEQGKLSIKELKAIFYGSTLEAQLEAEFAKGINFKTVLSCKEFRLEDLVKTRKLESVLMGKASVEAVISAALEEAAQIPQALGGIWNIRISSGLWQGKDKDGKLKGSPTRFDLARASGKMIKGKLESTDILLKNSDMQISGEGWLNLVSHKIDCKLNVNMKNVPDFPLYVYGPMDNPKTSIGAGKLVLNAIGGIASGIGNMFGGFFRGIGSIFK